MLRKHGGVVTILAEILKDAHADGGNAEVLSNHALIKHLLANTTATVSQVQNNLALFRTRQQRAVREQQRLKVFIVLTAGRPRLPSTTAKN